MCPDWDPHGELGLIGMAHGSSEQLCGLMYGLWSSGGWS